jgi:hypothetical protein
VETSARQARLTRSHIFWQRFCNLMAVEADFKRTAIRRDVMRSLNMFCALAVVGFCNIGCETMKRAGDKIEETAVSAKDRVVAEVDEHRDLSVGCLPANKDPAESWRTTGDPLYVTPGCETSAAVSESASDDTAAADDAAGAEALPPMAEEEVVVAEDTEIVEGEGGTPCGLTVVALSAGAVGDPCMTTEAVIDSLDLSHAQKEAALADVSQAREMFGDVAH